VISRNRRGASVLPWVLPRSLNPERMEQNLDLFSFSIDAGDIASLSSLDRGSGVAWASGDPTLAA
jgi:2,5-diketo-D-gluconate reductase A